jgi:hypothetical protein
MDAARRYLATTVDAPANARQRLLHALLPLPRRTPPPPSDALTSLLFTTIAHEPRLAPADLRKVVRDGVDQDGRRRLLAFLFEGNATLPFAIAKAQEDLVNGSLRTEAESLDSVRPRLPEAARATVPEVLALHADARGEVLAICGLPGRSAWFDLRASLTPYRHAERHLRAAAQWLAAFHEATGAVHGDFWPGNVLLQGDAVTGVVDWEHYLAGASRYIDLFHFPLTYGLSFPWKRYRYSAPEQAFAATFHEDNPVSRAVRSYLQEYAQRTAIPMVRIDEAFHEFLATHGTMGSLPDAHPGTRHLPWSAFHAGRSSITP